MKHFIFGFATGSILTGGITYILLKRKHNKEISEMRLSEEKRYKEMEEYYIDKYSVKNAAVIKEDPSEIVKRYSNDEKETYNQIASTYSAPENYVDPAETEHPSEDSVPDAPDEYYEDEAADDEDPERRAIAEGMMADVYNKMNHSRAPEIISEEAYGNAPGFSYEECVYYVEDRTFCDSDENIIDDEGRAFGTCVTEWKDNHDLTDDIYIRNYGRGVDYRIEKMFCKCPAWSPEDE